MLKKYAKWILPALIIGTFTAMILLILFTPPSWFSAIVEKKNTTETIATLEGEDNRININAADIPELMQLEGLTKDMAIDILAYREEYRRFHEPDDLLQVEGITEELVESWKPYIYCG